MRICMLIGVTTLFAFGACSESPVTVEPPPPTPPLMALTSPSDSAYVLGAVNLEWRSDTAFRDYVVQVFLGVLDTGAVWRSEITNNSSYLFSPEVNDTTYYWRVGGLFGNRRIWSEIRSFKVSSQRLEWSEFDFAYRGITVSYEVRTILTRQVGGVPVSDTSYEVRTRALTAYGSGRVDSIRGMALYGHRLIFPTGSLEPIRYDIRAQFAIGQLTLKGFSIEFGESSSYLGHNIQTYSSSWTGVSGSSLKVLPQRHGYYHMNSEMIRTQNVRCIASQSDRESVNSSQTSTFSTTTRQLETVISSAAAIELTFR